MRLNGKKRRKAPAQSRTVKVQRIPPTAEAARDEGPRLIPLDEPSKEASRMDHSLDLADTALGLKAAGKGKP